MCADANTAARARRCGCGRGERKGLGWEVGLKTRDTNLFVDRVALSEYEVTTEQPREKGIMRSRLAAVQLPLDEQEGLVDGDEFREIRRVLLRRARDGFQPGEPTCVS